MEKRKEMIETRQMNVQEKKMEVRGKIEDAKAMRASSTPMGDGANFCKNFDALGKRVQDSIPKREDKRGDVRENMKGKLDDRRASTTAKLDDKRRKLIRARLKDFSEADLCRALDGYARSPHHQGQNDRNTRYVTLELWFRDTAHVEAGMAMVPTPTTVPATAENIAVPPEWQ